MNVAKYFCWVYGRGCANASDEISFLSTPASATASITTFASISCSSTCSSASRGLCHLATGSAAAPRIATLVVIMSLRCKLSGSPSSAYDQRVGGHHATDVRNDRVDVDLIDDIS